MRPAVGLALALLVQACSPDARPGTADGDLSAPDAGSLSAPDAGAPQGPSPLVEERPFGLVVPSSYAGQPSPLVVLLHGYGANGAGQAAYFGLDVLARQRGFFLATPDGTLDRSGRRFWNATNACCDFLQVGVDDVAYVDAIIDDVARRYSIDPKRVYVVGHSNGGFMAHRYACDRSSRVAAIVSLAGAVWKDPTRCAPTTPVAVLQIHGDADEVVSYQGGIFLSGQPPYPGAKETVATWAAKNGCAATPTPSGETHDLDTLLPGAETIVERHGGCQPGGAAELWTIEGGRHVPSLGAQFPTAVLDFLLAHPKR